MSDCVLIFIVLCAWNNRKFILLFYAFSEIFKDEVKYILCLTTPIDIVLLAVTFTSKRLGMFIIMFYNDTNKDCSCEINYFMLFSVKK